MTEKELKEVADSIVRGNWTKVYIDSVPSEDWTELTNRIASALRQVQRETHDEVMEKCAQWFHTNYCQDKCIRACDNLRLLKLGGEGA